jgi:hypothetical protein
LPVEFRHEVASRCGAGLPGFVRKIELATHST